ncbi:MAG: hypothetical protein ABJF10_27900 [Chthoniobacter sp.]|uniref:hypothetical protein n=1 Tax=Chthoniobacter sp. TaxID=2510640 RepID=UPI0032A562BF
MSPIADRTVRPARMVPPLPTPSNAPSDSQLPILTGYATVLATALLWLGTGEVGSAQFSFGNSASPVAEAPVEQPWPAVEWGMQPMAPVLIGRGGLPTAIFTEDASPQFLSLDSVRGNVSMRFRVEEGAGLGPVVSIVPPSTAEGGIDRPQESKSEPGELRLGNVSFNQAADSFKMGKIDARKADDISRQFGGPGIASKDVAAGTSINAWAVVGIAALAVIVAMTIGFFENDRDDRQRRKKSRRRRHRHSS